MGTFNASLRTQGDRSGLPTTVRLENGRLSIAAGEEPIGDWDLSEVELERIPTGYRMKVEGEQVALEMSDSEAFDIELTRNSKAGSWHLPKRKKRKPPEELADPPKRSAIEEPTAPETTSQIAVSDEPAERRRPKAGKLIELVDKLLDAAEKRWGALLPEWVFSRVMFWLAIAAVIITIVLPTLVSTILLIVGLGLVIFGGVVYSDPLLGTKWLPGRATPVHVLMLGVGVLLLGVLIGVIGNQ